MKKCFRPLAFACLVAATASPASAATIFLFIPGVPGQSTNEQHKNWIELESMQVGVANRTCSGITVTKTIDSSSPVLSTAALLGAVYPSMTMDFTLAGDANASSYLTYVLSNVSVTGLSQSTGGGLISESVSLFATTINVTYKLGNQSVTYPLNCVKK